MRHTWKENTCTRCGIERKRKHWKKLMAVVNHPPWNGYQHGCDMAYSDNGFKTWTFKAPQCQEPDNPEAVKRFREFLHSCVPALSPK